MKLGFISTLLLVIATSASAQTLKFEPQKPATRSKAQPAKAPPKESLKSDVPVAQVPPPATGPTGIGAIRLGMTMAAIRALPADEPVRLVGELLPAVDKTTPPPGTEAFEGRITVPLSTEPVKARLTFKDGILQGLSLSTEGENSLLEGLAKQIAERYGAGKIEDNRKDEQCIYRNGNSFTLKSGILSTEWITPDVGGNIVTTSFTDLTLNMCPSNLRYGSTLGLKMKLLSIRSTEKNSAAPKNNLF